jgi:hypothetical protein
LPRRKPAPVEVEGAICVEGFRAIPIGLVVERGQRFPLDDPLVQKFPTHFRGVVKLPLGGESSGEG